MNGQNKDDARFRDYFIIIICNLFSSSGIFNPGWLKPCGKSGMSPKTSNLREEPEWAFYWPLQPAVWRGPSDRDKNISTRVFIWFIGGNGRSVFRGETYSVNL